MSHRAVLFLFAMMQAQVMVSLAIAPTMICPERCADDGPDGRCPPACPSCAPSTHTAALGLACVPVTPAVVRERVPSVAILRPTDPEPADIFHVPKCLLA
ncbi:MAG: hypothetical protein U0807_15310 [Candidatus Binatia bacterium]